MGKNETPFLSRSHQQVNIGEISGGTTSGSVFLNSQPPATESSPPWWWHRIASPPNPPSDASFKQRDIVRRGQLASTILFWATVVFTLVIPIGLFGSNHTLLFIAFGLLAVAAIAIYLNRQGWVTVVGLILAVGVNGAIILSIMTNPGGLSPATENSFDLLVFGDVFIVSLLNPNWVILSALLNITFIVLELLFAPRTPTFRTVITNDFVPLITRPIEIQIIVSAVLWLWVRSATDAIKRADRAELITRLQSQLAEQDRAVVMQKQQLDASIQQVELMLEQVANGNLDARLPLSRENVLWSITGKLNNLLSRHKQLWQAVREAQEMQPRLERAMKVEIQYKRLLEAVSNLHQSLARAYRERRILQIAQRRTPLDPLIQDINGKYIVDPTSEKLLR